VGCHRRTCSTIVSLALGNRLRCRGAGSVGRAPARAHRSQPVGSANRHGRDSLQRRLAPLRGRACHAPLRAAAQLNAWNNLQGSGTKSRPGPDGFFHSWNRPRFPARSPCLPPDLPALTSHPFPPPLLWPAPPPPLPPPPPPPP